MKPFRSLKRKKSFRNKHSYRSELCTNKMTFQECELAILRQAVDLNELRQKKFANSEHIQKMIDIVESFLRKSKCICYGGTAINNILPKKAQFYNRDVEIPDYDFFSSKPLEHAKELADLFFHAGYADIEAKSGMHSGTFKVFVNFIPMADITELHTDLFSSISEEAIDIDGILYCPANFLRMNMYIELSRPNGDVSRWEKVLKRLTLLNQYYPLKANSCSVVDFQRSMDKTDSQEMEQIYTITRDAFIEQKVVFFGGYASSLYARFMNSSQQHLTKMIPDFDVLSDDIPLCSSIVKNKLEEQGIKHVSIISHPAVGETIPIHCEIRVGKDTIAFVYEPIACHSYNKIQLFQQEVRVATIDTMLSFYFAFLYGKQGYHYDYKERLLCMCQFLFEVEQKNRLAQNGLLKRFSMNCYGIQSTLEMIRAEKARKFEELKEKKDSYEYQRLFLKYHPTGVSVQKHSTMKRKTIRKPIRKQKQKPYEFVMPKRTQYLF